MIVQRVVSLAKQVLAKVDDAAAAVEAMPAGGHRGLGLALCEIKSQAKTTILNAKAIDQPDNADGEDEPRDDGELISPVSS